MLHSTQLSDDLLHITTATTESVFNSTRNQASYFKGGHWGQCLELLQHLCQYNQNLVLIIAQAGLGKTSLQREFVTKNRDLFKCVALNAGDYAESTTLLHAISTGLHLKGSSSVSNIASDLINTVTNTAETAVLLVDDAHLLSQAMLQDILKLYKQCRYGLHKQSNTLRLILLGQPTLEKNLELLKLELYLEEAWNLLELEPLTALEIEPYLLHKWRAYGNKIALPFDGALLKKIYQLAAGNPRLIEQFANNYLATGKLNINTTPKLATFAKTAFRKLPQAMAIIAVLSIVGIVLLKPLLIDTSAPAQKISLPIPSAPAKLSSAISTAAIDPQQQTKVINVAIKADPSASKPAINSCEDRQIPITTKVGDHEEAVLPRVLELEQQLQQQQAKASAAKTAPTTWQPNSKQPDQGGAIKPNADHNASIATVAPDVVNAKVSLVSPNITGIIVDPVTAAATANPSIQDLKIVKQNKVIDPSRNNQNSQLAAKKAVPLAKNLVAPANTTIAASKTSVLKPAQPEKTSKQQSQVINSTLAKLAPNGFTIQLLGSAKLAGVLQYVKQHNLHAQAYYITVVRQQQPWYVLLYGHYKTRAQAKAALQILPGPVRAAQPWVRELKSLQQSAVK